MSLTPRANFSSTGLDIGRGDRNMTYLYGISDFFTLLFEDTETVNLMLEANSQSASEVYSNFLQLTSTLSLSGIQETIGSSIKLILLSSSDVVPGQSNVYRLPENILSSRYVANKPFLPTTLMEESVDFRIETQSSGNPYIRFAKDISTQGFPIRVTSTGETQYALWFVDANIDEGLISTFYGNLLGLDPTTSTEEFHNFVSGLFYLYTQGPTLSLIAKGLNLVLGIPLARDEETVLDIRTYIETSQTIVVTTANQYLLPYGLSPSVVVGDVLAVGDSIAQWVVVKDYISDGKWWIDARVPEKLIPYTPPGQKDRYATEGSIFDQIFSQYLKKHTFMVLVNVANFKDQQYFQELSDIISKVKPSYTSSVYVWSIQNLDETLTLSDDGLSLSVEIHVCEELTLPIERMYRGNTIDPLTRGCPRFLRWNVPQYVTELCGKNDYYTSFNPIINDVTISEFRNPRGHFVGLSDRDKAWVRAICKRNSSRWQRVRSGMGYNRMASYTDDDLSGLAVKQEYVDANYVIPLYITTDYDISNKFASINMAAPADSSWYFTIPDLEVSQAINEFAIDSTNSVDSQSVLVNNYQTLFYRTNGVNYINRLIPQTGYAQWAPDISLIGPGDYLLGVRIFGNAVGVYWVTSTVDPSIPYCAPITDSDPLQVSFKAPLSRGLTTQGIPFYLTRGQAQDSTYTDAFNKVVPIDRSGVSIQHTIIRN